MPPTSIHYCIAVLFFRHLRFASGTNQNCGNFMTDVPTSRVLAPPGGSSQAGSLIFGGGASADDRFGNRRSKNTNVSAASKKPLVEQGNQQPAQETTYGKQQTRAVSSNAFANGTNQNCGNFISDRPTSRVLAPPGGRSSGPLW